MQAEAQHSLVCAACAGLVSGIRRRGTNDDRLSSYWLIELSTSTDFALHICNSCYCAATNATTEEEGRPHFDAGWSQDERRRLFAVEYFLRTAVPAVPDLTLTDRILKKLDEAQRTWAHLCTRVLHVFLR